MQPVCRSGPQAPKDRPTDPSAREFGEESGPHSADPCCALGGAATSILAARRSGPPPYLPGATLPCKAVGQQEGAQLPATGSLHREGSAEPRLPGLPHCHQPWCPSHATAVTLVWVPPDPHVSAQLQLPFPPSPPGPGVRARPASPAAHAGARGHSHSGY